MTRRLFGFSILLLAMLPDSSAAALVGYEFQGSVSPVFFGAAFGETFPKAAKVEGRFLYDPDSSLTSGGGSSPAWYLQNIPHGFSASFGDEPIVVRADTYFIKVANNVSNSFQTVDSFAIHFNTDELPGATLNVAGDEKSPAYFLIDFTDFSASVFENDELPNHLDLGALMSDGKLTSPFNMLSQSTNLMGNGIAFSVTSLTRFEVMVPESSTACLLAVGVFFLLALRFNRRLA